MAACWRVRVRSRGTDRGSDPKPSRSAAADHPDIPAVARSRDTQHAGLANRVRMRFASDQHGPTRKAGLRPAPVKLLSEFRRYAPVALPRGIEPLFSP